MANRIRVTAAKKKQFLKELENVPNISRAARITGIARRYWYTYKEQEGNEEFAEEWEDAFERGVDRAEEELYRRAVEGYDKPLTYQGERTGHVIREYSDTLLIFLLKGRRSEVFKDRAEVGGPGGGPLHVNVTIGNEE